MRDFRRKWIEPRAFSMIVRCLYLSPGHNFFGHHGQEAGTHPIHEMQEIECVAGHGIRGDRFFDYKRKYKGQITFFSSEVFAEVCRALAAGPVSPGAARRNVVTEGVDLNALIGRRFAVQGIEFEGVCECSPCYWMDRAIAPGAEKALRGRGGLRARILTSGVLRAGI
jgi:MOSC domain-containing protein YiiM